MKDKPKPRSFHCVLYGEQIVGETFCGFLCDGFKRKSNGICEHYRSESEAQKRLELNVTPFSAPRMVQSDRWRKRPVVLRYWDNKDALISAGQKVGFTELPTEMGFIFEIPMAKSWSKKKKSEMLGQLHQQKPDLDNLIKAVKDSFGKDDSHVAVYTSAKKVWSEKGRIILFVK